MRPAWVVLRLLQLLLLWLLVLLLAAVSWQVLQVLLSWLPACAVLGWLLLQLLFLQGQL
jgi:hypothetical protein